MTNLTKRCAFTLSELLLALIIVGVLAVFTIPVIVNHIQTRIFVTKLKNTVAEIEQVAKQELIRHHTRDLSNTDFADPELLLSDKHFAIIKKCSASNSQKDCWKTAATGKNKVTYKTYTRSLITLGEKTTIILKNSIALSYTLDSNDGKTIGNFTFDINGSQKPNILGKDYFGFFITPKGNIIDIASLKNQKSLSAMKKNCSTGFYVGHWCYSFLISNNYKMNY